ncbi:MAG: cation transporter [Verrucomicrobia bacterium]|nr:cation transporter [Verrucomicrobiota bacterium]MBV8482848.1 cation transporter [Verrucomicrobiota bacterium]
MAHDHHSHDEHSHGHSHAPTDFGWRFMVGVVLNLVFVVVEAGFGFAVNSLALVADAGHNLSDVLGLALAWGAFVLSRRAPSSRRTYGMRRSSILAALFNALFLLFAIGAIAWEAVQRFWRPEPVSGWTVVIVALIGIAVNGVTTMLFAGGQKEDLNVRAAFLHMAADTAVSAGVVLGGLLILYTQWYWIDPVLSLAIAVIIFWGTWGLLRESVDLSLDAVPTSIDPKKVKAFLESWPDVTAVHDLHIWPLSTTDFALTAHLVMPDHDCNDEEIQKISQALASEFGITHSTLQIERGSLPCPFASEEAL